MRGVVLFIFLVHAMFATSLFSQNHVTWSANWDEESKKVLITGTIDAQWHLYSPKTKGDLGPIPLTARFTTDKGIKRKGKLCYLTEAKAHQDENFGGLVYTWEKSVQLSQKFNAKQEGDIIITLNYMVCDETRCIPPIDKSMTIKIKKK